MQQSALKYATHTNAHALRTARQEQSKRKRSEKPPRNCRAVLDVLRSAEESKVHSAMLCRQNGVHQTLAGRKLLCGGGGGDTEAHFPNPPPLSLAAVTGGGVQGGGVRPAVPGGGGVNPTSMAQNDTHVALIILTTQMWGGGGDYWWKKLFRASICVPAPLAPTSVLTQKKGPTRNPISPTPPPIHVTPPPPPGRAIFRSPLINPWRNS